MQINTNMQQLKKERRRIPRNRQVTNCLFTTARFIPRTFILIRQAFNYGFLSLISNQYL